jgi:hypothetical protein
MRSDALLPGPTHVHLRRIILPAELKKLHKYNFFDLYDPIIYQQFWFKNNKQSHTLKFRFRFSHNRCNLSGKCSRRKYLQISADNIVSISTRPDALLSGPTHRQLKFRCPSAIWVDDRPALPLSAMETTDLGHALFWTQTPCWYYCSLPSSFISSPAPPLFVFRLCGTNEALIDWGKNRTSKTLAPPHGPPFIPRVFVQLLDPSVINLNLTHSHPAQICQSKYLPSRKNTSDSDRVNGRAQWVLSS